MTDNDQDAATPTIENLLQEIDPVESMRVQTRADGANEGGTGSSGVGSRGLKPQPGSS